MILIWFISSRLIPYDSYDSYDNVTNIWKYEWSLDS
jgi:hypothetical protein